MEKFDKRNIENVLALTPMQEGMLFHYLKDPESELYFEQLSLAISGEINLGIFEKTWNFVIETNEMLRTVFQWEKMEKPVQIILKKHKLQCRYFDFPGEEYNRKKKKLEEIKIADRKEKFDLRKVPFRVTLCKTRENRYVMIISNHHILYDGWSNGIILKEFFKTYDDLARGKELLKPIKTKFKEFVKWNQDQDKEKQEKFWRKYLNGFYTPTEFSVKKRKSKEIISTAADSFKLAFSKELKDKIEDFVKSHKITLAALFYSVWGILLHRYNNSEDIVFGTTVSGRNAKVQGIEEIAGLFINTLPLRIQTDTNEKTDDFLYRIDKQLQLREAFETTALVEIKGYSEVDNKEELFDSIVVIENYPLDSRLRLESSNLSVDSYSIFEKTNYDLLVSIIVFNSVELTLSYNKDIFEKEAIVRLADHFSSILENILENPGIEVTGIGIMSEEERNKLLYRFNNTRFDYPGDKTVHQLFEEQAERTPDNIAVIGEGFKLTRQQVTYKKLNRKSNRLAYLLKKKGVYPPAIVGIMPERSVEMITGIFAILKAGGSYLPIDPDYPQERVDYMLKDSGAKVLLTLDAINRVPRPQHLSFRPSTLLPFYPSRSSSLAYTIYTSGSTGKPKGVIIGNRSLVNFIEGIANYVDIRESDNVLSLTTISFDIFGLEAFLPLVRGAKLNIGNEEAQMDPQESIALMDRKKITIFQLTPSRLKLLLDARGAPKALGALRYLLVGGEEFPETLLKQVRKITGGKIYNLYGPTETTIWSTIKDVTGERPLNIGKPIANTFIYIVNKNLELQPLGVPGELCIAGDGLARGYLNRPELTAEKFDHDLWDYQDGYHKSYWSYRSYILYHTGDLARWLSDGNIEFLGRIDHQVKIRGHRIEMGEIETQLLNHNGIKEAFILAAPPNPENSSTANDNDKNKNLYAYVVPRKGRELTQSELREQLAGQLPVYMIPNYFVILEKIPLNSNGKIDRKALPRPQIHVGAEFQEPRNELEMKVAQVWQSVLGVEKVGINDNFFEIGGDSIKAIQVSGMVQKFGLKVEVKDLMLNPTIKQSSRYVKKITPITDRSEVEGNVELTPHDVNTGELENKIGKNKIQNIYRLTPMQQGMFFHFLKDSASNAYFEQTIILIKGKIETSILEKSFDLLVNRHDILRTCFVYGGMDEPVQAVLKDREVNIGYKDLSHLKEKSRQHYLLEFRENQREKGFNLLEPGEKLMRISLFKTGKDLYTLAWSFHHIILDGWSLGILFKELLQAYRSLKNGDTVKLEPVMPYKNYIQWIERQDNKDGLKYWQEYLAGYEQPAGLPKARDSIHKGEYKKKEYPLIIDEELTGRLGKIAKLNHVTLSEVFQVLWGVLLQKYSNQNDVVFGMVVSGRSSGIEGIERMAGLFINTIPMRIEWENHNKFLKILEKAHIKSVSSKPYEYVPLADIQAKHPLRHRLIDHILVFENYPLGEELRNMTAHGAPGIGFRVEDTMVYGHTNYDLNIVISPGKTIFINFSFNSLTYESDLIKRVVIHFENVIKQAAANPDIYREEIEIITPAEKHRLLFEFNDTETEYPKEKTIHRLFEEQVKKTPDHTVLVGVEGTRGLAPLQIPISITYRELNNKSNQLAYLLQVKGVKPGTIVGLMMQPSGEMVTGILGILKTGCAYLPMAADSPGYRIVYMLKDSNAQALVINASLVKKSGNFKTGSWQGTVIPLPMRVTDLKAETKPPARGQQPSTDLIYAIYTSGSTGKPKGVLLTHKNLVNYVSWFSKAVQLSQSDRSVLTSSFAFDLGYTALYPPLLKGGELHLVLKETYMLAGTLCDYIEANMITYLKMTPSLFSTIAEVPAYRKKLDKTLRLVILGGERIDTADVEKVHNRCKHLRVINHYGPSEAAIGSAAQFIDFSRFDDYRHQPTIGYPIHNTRIYILGKNLELLPANIPGELCISGDGLARGYLNRPQLTAEKFDHNFNEKFLRGGPGGAVFSKSAPPGRRRQKIYKTGDLARWLSNGCIEFLGRIDHQVKIRGFRIELGEIEDLLLKHNKIKETAVMISENPNGDKYICAYIVSNNAPALSELREYLLKVLPDYMIPSYFEFIDHIPLTPNGKIDRKALPVPGVKTGTEHIAPGDDIEKKLVEIWSELLGIEKESIGMESNFFELGGQSLKAAILVSRIHKAFDAVLPLSEIFRIPFIRELARYIKNAAARNKYTAIEPAEKKEFYILSSAQKRLYFLQRMEPACTRYNSPRVLSLAGTFDSERFTGAVVNLINRHEGLRTAFVEIGDEPVQKIYNRMEFEIEHLYINPVHDEKVEMTIDDFVRPFELSGPPPVRIRLIKCEKEKHVLMIDMHHIISDGVSIGIFTNELMALYSENDLSGLKLQYKDYSEWQNKSLESPGIKKQEGYWLEQFAGNIPTLQLPTDYKKPDLANFDGDTLGFEINRSLTSRLMKIVTKMEITLFMLLFAVYNVLIYLYKKQDQIIIGSPAAGRTSADLQYIIGMFVNMLALKNSPAPDKKFADFLMEVKKNTLKAYENQDYQFDQLVKKLGLKRLSGSDPLINTVFTLQNAGVFDFQDPAYNRTGLEINIHPYETDTVKFDLTLDVMEKEGSINMWFTYSTARFMKSTIQRLKQHFIEILEQVVRNIDIKLKDISLSHDFAAAKSSLLQKDTGNFDF